MLDRRPVPTTPPYGGLSGPNERPHERARQYPVFLVAKLSLLRPRCRCCPKLRRCIQSWPGAPSARPTATGHPHFRPFVTVLTISCSSESLSPPLSWLIPSPGSRGQTRVLLVWYCTGNHPLSKYDTKAAGPPLQLQSRSITLSILHIQPAMS